MKEPVVENFIEQHQRFRESICTYNDDGHHPSSQVLTAFLAGDTLEDLALDGFIVDSILLLGGNFDVRS